MSSTTTQPTLAPHTTPPSLHAITIQNLSHTYPTPKKSPRNKKQPRNQKSEIKNQKSPPAPALSDINLTIPNAKIFTILGPNGSGKSTLLHILATLIKPTTGTATIFGQDIKTHAAEVRKHIGVVFQTPCLDRHLSARENLRHHADLYGLPKRDMHTRIDQLLTCVGIIDRADDPVSQFSGGMKRRTEIAKTLLSAPDLLLMDEPTNGLDPTARRELWQILETLRDQLGTTIAMATHELDAAENCDQLAILDRGQLIAYDTPTNLIQRIGGDVITIEPASHLDQDAQAQFCQTITDLFAPWPDPDAVPTQINHTIRFEHRNADNVIATLRRDHTHHIKRITLGSPTLDDVFTHLTGHAFHPPTPPPSPHFSPA